MARHVFTLDLKDNERLIAEYVKWHQNVWPEIKESIKSSGISGMEIYRYGTRLFLLMDVEEGFTFRKKAAMDAANPRVQEWEELMWKYQKPLPGTKPGEKWILMEKMFDLGD
ncbi:L-rhamnose mutarotase [Desertivirga arenae]|uniref:L-rhamnose mutarotase n=1 Tax=Desertivirga arenae TaxID=2810309 RepID=UPI001A959EA0|nr:L-rhamnose mutarotase [Pedobacter sp. SYSU D00823]